MLLVRGDKQEFFELDCWFYYRYFCQNPDAVTEEYIDFYNALDKFFVDKYSCETEAQTREYIKRLFVFESERVIIVCKETIDRAMAEYKADPSLLATFKEKREALIERLEGMK